MTHQQRGAYFHLLCLCWANASCTLPHDSATLQSTIHWNFPSDEFVLVFKCFHPLKKGSDRCTNPRLYREWQAATTLLARQSEGGEKGARKRWEKATTRTTRTLEKKPISDWLETIKQNPVYTHVNWPHELGKMQQWLKDHPGRRFTRDFVRKWVNKIDPPLSNGHAKPHCPLCKKDYVDLAALKTHTFSYHPEYRG